MPQVNVPVKLLSVLLLFVKAKTRIQEKLPDWGPSIRPPPSHVQRCSASALWGLLCQGPRPLSRSASRVQSRLLHILPRPASICESILFSWHMMNPLDLIIISSHSSSSPIKLISGTSSKALWNPDRMFLCPFPPGSSCSLGTNIGCWDSLPTGC